jgi:pimeloyl-ACP methyl ester carboxylesterase
VTPSVYRRAEGQQAIAAWCRRAIDRWTTPHETRILRTSLGDTSVVVAGGGRLPPVVVLPGTNFSVAAMLDFGSYLARHRQGQVLLVDLPGQPGLSDPHRAPNPRAYGAWLDEVLAQLDPVPQPIVVGHSLGAAIVLHSTTTSRVVLVAPAGFVGAQLSRKLLQKTVPWLVRPSDLSAYGLACFMSAPTSEPADVTVEWLRIVGRHCRATKAPAPVPSSELARWSGHDLRLVLGADDPFFRPDRVVAAARTAHLEPTRITVVAGAGHLVPEERPQAILEALD